MNLWSLRIVILDLMIFIRQLSVRQLAGRTVKALTLFLKFKIHVIHPAYIYVMMYIDQAIYNTQFKNYNLWAKDSCETLILLVAIMIQNKMI